MNGYKIREYERQLSVGEEFRLMTDMTVENSCLEKMAIIMP